MPVTQDILLDKDVPVSYSHIHILGSYSLLFCKDLPFFIPSVLAEGKSHCFSRDEAQPEGILRLCGYTAEHCQVGET